MSDCYVAIKPCGCVVAAAVINPDHKRDTAKSVASWVRDGLRVETHPVEWVREHMRAAFAPAFDRVYAKRRAAKGEK